MPHSLLVNRSVFFIPREYKALPSVQILFTKLRSHLPFCPARDDRPRFFVFIFVVTVSAYHDQHFVTWKKQQKTYIIEQFVAFWYTGCSAISGLDVVSKGEGLSCIVLVKTPTSLMPYSNGCINRYWPISYWSKPFDRFLVEKACPAMGRYPV